MVNFIKMNMLRFIKMKTVYIMLLVTALVGVLFILDGIETTSLQEQHAVEEVQQTVEEDSEEKTDEFGIIKPPVEIQTMEDYVEQFNSSGIMPLEMAIFIIIFALGERNSGFLKNLNVCTKKKYKIIVSKLVPAAVFFMIQNMMVILSLLFGNFVSGCGLVFGNVVALAVQLVIQLLLHLAFAASLLALAELIRNNTACICIGIFASLGMGTLIVSVICDLISKLIAVPNLGQYMLIQRIAMTVSPLDMTILPVTLLIGGAALVIYIALTNYMAKKRDIY